MVHIISGRRRKELSKRDNTLEQMAKELNVSNAVLYGWLTSSALSLREGMHFHHSIGGRFAFTETQKNNLLRDRPDVPIQDDGAEIEDD